MLAWYLRTWWFKYMTMIRMMVYLVTMGIPIEILG
jgi:hypothetical protein